ncbi:hypothetical protein S245_031112, partial [Arachis hypogaea]
KNCCKHVKSIRKSKSFSSHTSRLSFTGIGNERASSTEGENGIPIQAWSIQLIDLLFFLAIELIYHVRVVCTGKESDSDFVQNVISRANMEKRLNELEAAKSEIQSWHSSIQNEPCVSAGATPEPKMLLDFLQTLKSSEESLREHLEKAKKKEAAFIVTFAKREQEIAELKVSCSTLFLSPLPFVAISDYKQSLQFRDLNEKRNIRLEVIRGGRRIEISIYCRWQWCYALMASGSDDALKSVGLVLA